ncbi:MAG TPA: hypothetical protein VES88_00490, partial [Gemmatimonadaceae bacterium]|nr:hypothetical protein [Gemmatimonadaceae bacterium]
GRGMTTVAHCPLPADMIDYSALRLFKALIALLFCAVTSASPAFAQMSEVDMVAMAAHMEMTPRRLPTTADSIRAMGIVAELRTAVARYRDIRVAEADGFKMFAPQLKNQRVYHFTKNLWALENQFRFNPGKPTSLLYRKDDQGRFVLIGAMYTAPKQYSAADLDKRIPTSVAQWHKHVNWCLPRRREKSRWVETKNGRPVFGPLGVATREACDAADGRFMKEVFGWMVHASVFASDDPKVIWGEHHMRGDEMMDHGH